MATRTRCRPAQDGATGSGSNRNDDALGHAQGRSGGTHRVAAISGSIGRPAEGATPRPYGPYRELRSKPVLPPWARCRISAWYLCALPAAIPGVELDINTGSPGAPYAGSRGRESAFDHARRQMKLLADLEVTTKAVERTRSYGEISPRGGRDSAAVQLDLPVIVENVPIRIRWMGQEYQW